MSNDRYSIRIRLIFGGFVVLTILLAGKLYLVQVVHGQDFRDRAERQYSLPRTAVFDRGTIYFEDRKGDRISAATLDSGFVVAISPPAVTDIDALYKALSKLMTLDKTEFYKKARKVNDPYEEIAHRVSKETADTIKELKLPGVSIYKEQWRLYPGGTRAAHTLGFVAYDTDTLIGRYGLEKYYENILSRAKDNLYVNFFAEVFSNVRDVVKTQEGEGEGDIVTTIEPTVQGFLEDALNEYVAKWSPRSAGGIIIDPITGEVRALALTPTFDPNQFQKVKDGSVFLNPLIQNVFEMGSIMKPITVASGIDAGVITPDTTYNDTGSLTVDGYTISNYDKRGRGVVDMYHVLGESLNTGVAFIVRRLGNKRFADYVHKFGFDKETGIDLPGEVHGLVNNLTSPRDVEYVTASFGQGIAVSPIEMVRALSVLANGGVLITPHVVKKIEYDLGLSKTLSYPAGERVISKEASDAITKILVHVVDKYLLGGTVMLDHYSIAAKTGTAQIANKQTGGYYDDRYLHSFFGYFPAYEPRFLVFLFSLEPKNAKFASETLTPPFMNITKFLINYYQIPPDR